MASFDLEDLFSNLPYVLLEGIFQYLTVEDLCRVATCSRVWREAANSDVLWRPLCRQKGWERYGTVTDLCKEIPFAPASQEQDTDQGSNSVSFPNDLLVNGSAWPGLADTCKWKEVFMKARHLEANWLYDRYHVVSFEFGSVAYVSEWHEFIITLNNLDGEGSFLAGSVGVYGEGSTLGIWDATNGHCRHLIKTDASKERHALKMKNGIVAVGCVDGKIRTYSVQTGEQLHVFSGHRLAVTRLFFDGETIVSVAQCQYSLYGSKELEDDDVRVWSLADGSCRFVIQSISQLVDLDYLDKTVAVAYDASTIRLWDVRTGTCRRTIVTGAKEIVSCNLGDGFVISASKGNDIRMWNLDSGECMKTFDVPEFEFEDPDDFENEDVSHSFLSNELLFVHFYSDTIRIFNLNGKFAGDDLAGQHLICVHCNKIVTSWGDESNYLWLIDRRDGITVACRYGMALKPEMAYHHTSDAEYSMAWMSDTKLAFVHYYDAKDPNPIRSQTPKIFVHHYW